MFIKFTPITALYRGKRLYTRIAVPWCRLKLNGSDEASKAIFECILTDT